MLRQDTRVKATAIELSSPPLYGNKSRTVARNPAPPSLILSWLFEGTTVWHDAVSSRGRGRDFRAIWDGRGAQAGYWS